MASITSLACVDQTAPGTHYQDLNTTRSTVSQHNSARGRTGSAPTTEAREIDCERSETYHGDLLSRGKKPSHPTETGCLRLANRICAPRWTAAADKERNVARRDDSMGW